MARNALACHITEALEVIKNSWIGTYIVDGYILIAYKKVLEECTVQIIPEILVSQPRIAHPLFKPAHFQFHHTWTCLNLNTMPSTMSMHRMHTMHHSVTLHRPTAVRRLAIAPLPTPSRPHRSISTVTHCLPPHIPQPSGPEFEENNKKYAELTAKIEVGL